MRVYLSRHRTLALIASLLSLVIAASAGAVRLRVATLGASATDEYFGTVGTPFGAKDIPAMNWLEQLADDRYAYFDFGLPETDPSVRGEPRNDGYSLNWARYGAAAVGPGWAVEPFSSQVAGAAAQIKGGDVDFAYIMIGGNDFHIREFAGLTFDPDDPGYQAFEQAIFDAIWGAVDTLEAAGTATISVGAFGVRPLPEEMYQAALGLNWRNGLEAYFRGVPFIVPVDFIPPGATEIEFAGEVIPIGSVADAADLAPPGTPGVGPCSTSGCATEAYAFNWLTHDGNHLSTIVAGLMANEFIRSVNSYFGYSIPELTEQEILANAIQVDPDPDGDGVPKLDDNCPRIANPDQEDADGDGFGDVCDHCPTIFSDDYESAACLAVHEPEDSCRVADVDLLGGPPQQGDVTVEQIVIGYGTFTKRDGAGTSWFDEITPDLRIARGSHEGVFNLGTDEIQWAMGTCAAPTSPFYPSHSEMLQTHFTTVYAELPGSDTCLRDITTGVDYDIHWESWSCCGAGGFAYSRNGLPVRAPVVTVPYDNSELPWDIDISALDDGESHLCVSARDVLPAPTTVSFTKLDSDPDDGSVRDEISANLQITRGSSRGVFNLGTDEIQWAVGTCAAPTSPFYSSHSYMLRIHFSEGGVDETLPGSDTCLFNVDSNRLYDVLWDSWSCCDAGGFAYTRTGPFAGPPVKDCTTFTKSGEDRIGINGPCMQALVGKVTLKIGLKFNKPSKDKILVKIRDWQLPAGVVPTDVTVNVGGAECSGTLDAKGRFKSPDGRDAMKMKQSNKTQLWSIAVKRKKHDFEWDLWDEGCTDADNPKPGLPVTVPLIIRVGGVAYGRDVDLVYKSKQGQKGTAK